MSLRSYKSLSSVHSLRFLVLPLILMFMLLGTPMSQAQLNSPAPNSPDLKLQFDTIPTGIEANQTTSITFSLTNDGNHSLDNLVVVLSKASDRRGGFQQVSTHPVASIGVNQTINSSLSYEDVAGTHTLRLVVIYNNTELANTAVMSQIEILTPPVGDAGTILLGLSAIIGSILAIVVFRPIVSKYIHL